MEAQEFVLTHGAVALKPVRRDVAEEVRVELLRWGEAAKAQGHQEPATLGIEVVWVEPRLVAQLAQHLVLQGSACDALEDNVCGVCHLLLARDRGVAHEPLDHVEELQRSGLILFGLELQFRLCWHCCCGVEVSGGKWR